MQQRRQSEDLGTGIVAAGRAVCHVVDSGQGRRDALGRVLAEAGLKASFIDGRASLLQQIADLAPGFVLLFEADLRIDCMALMTEISRKRRDLVLILVARDGGGALALGQVMDRIDQESLPPFPDAVMKRILAVLASPSPASGQAEPRAGSRLAKPVEETASDPLAILSKREREVLEGLVEGLANKAIAFRLGISQRTVEVHRANIMRRLGVGSFAELIRLAIMAGSGRPDPLH